MVYELASFSKAEVLELESQIFNRVTVEFSWKSMKLLPIYRYTFRLSLSRCILASRIVVLCIEALDLTHRTHHCSSPLTHHTRPQIPCLADFTTLPLHVHALRLHGGASVLDTSKEQAR